MSSESEYEAYNKLLHKVSQIAETQEELVRRLETLNDFVRVIDARVKELDTKVGDLATRINAVEEGLQNLRSEFHREVAIIRSKISDVEKRVELVEKRIEQAEENLDRHLREQDEVLESHGEALLNNIALQIMSSVKSRYSEEASVTLLQTGKTPLIVVEDHRRVMMILIAEKYEETYQKMLESLKQEIEVCTDKETLYKILALEIPRELSKELQQVVEPVWAHW